MKSIMIFAVAFAMTWPCCASDSLGSAPAFRIIDYKPVGFMMQSLIISPSFNVYGSGDRDTSSSAGSKQEESSGDGSLNASARYYLRNQRRTDDVEASTNVHFSSSIYGGSTEQTDNGHAAYSDARNPQISYGISNTTRYRKYIANNLFLEGMISPLVNDQPVNRASSRGSTITSLGTDSSEYIASRYEDSSQQLTISTGLNGSIGKGWIADMTAAAIALHMADCMERLKASPQKLTNSQLQDLSLAIDRLRRRRIFDSRIANIESVDTLCQFLLSEKCIDTATVRLAMEINDIWNYGFTQTRRFGAEIKCTPTATVYYNHSTEKSLYYSRDSIGPNDPATTAKDVAEWQMTQTGTYESHVTDFFLTYGGMVDAAFSRPFGRYFEVDGSVEVSGTLNTLYDSTSSYQGSGMFKGTYPDATGKLSLSLTWFPTLRATISLTNQLTCSGDFRFISRTDSDTSNLSTWANTQRRIYMTEFSTGASVRYFLSPRFSFDISGSVDYASGTKRVWAGVPYTYGSDLGRWDVSYGTDLTYALF
jgi:hypothetical protein